MTLVLAGLLNGTGCLRFDYNSVHRKSGSALDAGMDASTSQPDGDASSQPDAQLTSASGSGAVGGGVAGDAGSSGNAGSGGSAMAADAGASDDAGSIAAAGSGGGGAGGAAGSGSGGASGAVTAIPFDNCLQGSGVLFCNGFEEALPWYPTPWDYKDGPSSDGSYAPSTTTKYYGAASGHFTTTGASRATRSQVAYQGQLLNGMKSGDLWLRYYYYLPSSVTLSPALSVSSMSQSTGNFQGCSVAIYPGYVTIENGFSLTSTQSAQAFPRDQWECLEQHVFIDSTNGVIELYMNGSSQPVTSTTTGNTIPSAGYGVVEVGINGVGTAQGQLDVYVDNVVISTSRYGCD